MPAVPKDEDMNWRTIIEGMCVYLFSLWANSKQRLESTAPALDLACKETPGMFNVNNQDTLPESYKGWLTGYTMCSSSSAAGMELNAWSTALQLHVYCCMTTP